MGIDDDDLAVVPKVAGGEGCSTMQREDVLPVLL